MSVSKIPERAKVVPKLYETDATKYAGPLRLQQTWLARRLRSAYEPRAYTRFAHEAFTEIEVTGYEHLNGINRPCVLVANHSSHLDTILTQTALPGTITSKLFYGAAQDRWFIKGKKKRELQPWYQSLALGTFPILRGGGIKALGYASELLEAGMHIFLFPEGTRAMQDELGEFKHGASILSLRHQAPIVPLYLSGLRDIRPKGSRDIVPGPVSMDIATPHQFSQGTDVVTATGVVRDCMNKQHRLRNPDFDPQTTRAA